MNLRKMKLKIGLCAQTELCSIVGSRCRVSDRSLSYETCNTKYAAAFLVCDRKRK